MGVGSQSTVGRQDIFGKYMYEKITKCPNFAGYLLEKYFSRISGQMPLAPSSAPVDLTSDVCYCIQYLCNLGIFCHIGAISVYRISDCS